MIINASKLLSMAPIVDMCEGKYVAKGGTSAGMSEAGYDIRIKQNIEFRSVGGRRRIFIEDAGTIVVCDGRFILASAIEEFQMPNNLVGIVHDKSTWARRGLSVFNTVVEPGWKGWLTLELVYHGEEDLIIPAGSGIAQVVFHQTYCEARYEGKYQSQPDRPVAAISSK